MLCFYLHPVFATLNTVKIYNYRNDSVSAGILLGGILAGCSRSVSAVAKYSVFDVANWFLCRAAVMHKKLQALCCYAQAWYYALKDLRLMNTEFQAWTQGAVAPVLYECFKFFRVAKIKIKGTPKFLFSVEDTAFLRRVCETYGDKTDNALEALSHHE